MKLRFDRGPLESGSVFDTPQDIIQADCVADVAPALAAIDAARSAGAWIAGYATYEMGYALEPRLAACMPRNRTLPLLRFGVYDAPHSPQALFKDTSSLSGFSPRWDLTRYTAAFDVVKKNIASGDFYQANLTFPMDAAVKGNASALYAALMARQAVKHGVLVEQDDLPDLLSRSPELFFRTDANGQIETRPMKGTQPRHSDHKEDAANLSFLSRDEKNRAENLMIVDLLRNDISRVAEVGSVEVPELFKVETYATVHQMVSLVRAKLRSKISLGDIFKALFPCGSITGAPKIRAMEVLADLEPWPRDIYCGTIGWAAPDGRSEFNVAIRTVMLEDQQAQLNVGGGVVWDSTADAEYEEALWKARFAQPI